MACQAHSRRKKAKEGGGMTRRRKVSLYEISLAIKARGMRTVEKMLETPPENCDLCGHKEVNLHPLAGHKLCEQCYLGETCH